MRWTTQGVAQRIERGVIDPDTGAGFHGLIGLDVSDDGVVNVDVSTWVGVGPDGTEIPLWVGGEPRTLTLRR